MRPTNRLFLFALIIFLLFGTVQTVFALEPAAEDFTSAFLATCTDPPISHSGAITSPSQVDYYAVDLMADQFFTIDVDTEKIGYPLDSILHVFDAARKLIAVSDESLIVPASDPASSAAGQNISPDPYLEMTVDVDGTYYLAISAETPGLGADTGSYTLLLKCSDPGQPTSQEFTWPVVVPDLLGATGSNPGSLIKMITPDENAESSLPFALSVGPIADIEYQYSTDTLLVAINQKPGNIITFDPATGDQGKTYSLVPSTGTVVPTVVALEAVEDEVYGIQADDTSGEEQFNLVLVTFDDTTLTATLTPVFPFYTQHVRALAYDQSEKILYGVSGTALLKIDLASVPIGIEEIPLTSLLFEIASMDFSHEDILYVVDILGNLFKVDLTFAQAEFMGLIDVSAEVSGLTFVVGEPPDVDPIKTLCSSTLTTSASASSATAAPKLHRFKRKKNPLHRAIGLFKFKGLEGETVTLNAELEQQESAEAAVEESSASELKSSWLRYWKGKGRVFLGIRDSIPDVDFRVRKKDQLPLTMSATLPADGTYYVMVIRPLLRFYKTDYCLTLKSDHEESQAWKSFDVAWPSDDSDDDSASTSAEKQ